MSPSEFDLRAALHDGEDGADFNVDQLVGAAQAHVAQRRVRIISTVTITVLAAGLGAGAVAILNHDHSSHASADSAKQGEVLAPHALGTTPEASRNAPGAVSSSGSVYGSVANVGSGAVGVVSLCPTSITDFDAAQYTRQHTSPRLFSTPVSTVVVCAYGTSSNARSPGLLQLQGTDASTLAASLNIDSKAVTPVPALSSQSCAAGGKVGQQYAIIGLAPNGKTAGAVTAQFDSACGATVTNGHTTRYAWLPPPSLRNKFFSVTPK